MTEPTPSPLNNVITIDDERIKNHLDRVVRGSVEETLNALLDAEAEGASVMISHDLKSNIQVSVSAGSLNTVGVRGAKKS